MKILPHKIANVYISEEAEEIKGKVALIPFLNQTSSSQAGEKVPHHFFKELERLGLLLVNEEEVGTKVPKSWEEALQVGKVLGAQTIFWGAITRYEEGHWVGPWRPLVAKYIHPILGIKVKLLDVETGSTIWAVDEVFDGSQPDVIKSWVSFLDVFDLMDYPRVITSFGTVEDDYRLGAVEMDMEKFTRFVCYEILRTLPR